MEYQSVLAIYNWFVVFFFILLSVIFFYQSWINLVKKQLTKFSWDTLIFVFLYFARGKNYSDKAKKTIITDPEKMKRLGTAALLRGAASIGMAIFWYINFLR
jgi:hypothetical protein